MGNLRRAAAPPKKWRGTRAIFFGYDDGAGRNFGTPEMATDSTLSESLAWLSLLRAPALGAAAIRALVARSGSAAAAIDSALRDATLPAGHDCERLVERALPA